ncbi:hypothetical protein B0H10DRAFT_2064117, partial [Mycena sp. CBHHK59/15]
TYTTADFSAQGRGRATRRKASTSATHHTVDVSIHRSPRAKQNSSRRHEFPKRESTPTPRFPRRHRD